MDFYSKAGDKIKKLRIEKGYTREKLAEYAYISPKFLYEIEKGHKGFSADTLYNLAKALSVSCEYIISDNYECEYDDEIYNTINSFGECKKKKLLEIIKLLVELK